MDSYVSNELRSAIRAALLKGGAEVIEEEERFVVESLLDLVAEGGSRLEEVFARLESGESPYTVFGRYQIPQTQYWIDVPLGVMPPGCDTANTIAVIRHVVRGRNPEAIADVGCGTGVLGLAALIAARQARCVFLDVDAAACDAARSNALRLGLADRCSVICQDARQSLAALKLDLVVANLPFVPSGDIPNLGARFRDFAPRLAVDGGHDGLAVFHWLGDMLHAALHTSGSMILQFGRGQREAVVASLGPRWFECNEDNLGYPNVVVVRRVK
ncbi:MAG: methyltransferase [Fimbriimonadaceae bacterium]|nr:methyltransferase [Fimbriimonadaceae bacterium]